MRTYLLIQALIFFLIALKLLKYSDELNDYRGNKRYSQGLDLKTTSSRVYQIRTKLHLFNTLLKRF